MMFSNNIGFNSIGLKYIALVQKLVTEDPQYEYTHKPYTTWKSIPGQHFCRW